MESQPSPLQIRLLSPEYNEISVLILNENLTLKDLTDSITENTKIVKPVLVIVRGESMYQLDQPETTILKAIMELENTVILHSSKTITQWGDLVSKDSERRVNVIDAGDFNFIETYSPPQQRYSIYDVPQPGFPNPTPSSPRQDPLDTRSESRFSRSPEIVPILVTYDIIWRTYCQLLQLHYKSAPQFYISCGSHMLQIYDINKSVDMVVCFSAIVAGAAPHSFSGDHLSIPADSVSNITDLYNLFLGQRHITADIQTSVVQNPTLPLNQLPYLMTAYQFWCGPSFNDVQKKLLLIFLYIRMANAYAKNACVYLIYEGIYKGDLKNIMDMIDHIVVGAKISNQPRFLDCNMAISFTGPIRNTDRAGNVTIVNNTCFPAEAKNTIYNLLS